MLRITIALLFVLSVGSTSSVTALENSDGPELSPIIITEIYANAPGSSESGKEYIEIHNTTNQDISLQNYTVLREGNDQVFVLDEITLAAGEYLAIFTPFSLLNSGGTVYLNYPPTELEEFVLEQSYLSLDETHSWSLINDIWQEAAPTPSEANPIVEPNQEVEIEEEEAEPEDVSSQLCDFNTVFINEIVANPAGSDTNGGEFVELYNEGDQLVSLEGCILSTDKLAELVLPETELAPNSYVAVELNNDLLNGGGTVTFITAINEYSVVYPALGDNESWSNINSQWEVSNVMTPGAENRRSPQSEFTTAEEAQDDCPAGKFRNPETNRCKTIVSAASSLLPCDPGSVRNPDTNRCRKVSSVLSATLKACDPGQERNPDTNRCRKTETTSSSLAACDEGEERNPDTNRCRKATGTLSGATIDNTTQEAGIHSGVFILMTLLAVAYGIYEYRLDFSNWYQKMKTWKLLQKQG